MDSKWNEHIFSWSKLPSDVVKFSLLFKLVKAFYLKKPSRLDQVIDLQHSVHLGQHVGNVGNCLPTVSFQQSLILQENINWKRRWKERLCVLYVVYTPLKKPKPSSIKSGLVLMMIYRHAILSQLLKPFIISKNISSISSCMFFLYENLFMHQTRQSVVFNWSPQARTYKQKWRLLMFLMDGPDSLGLNYSTSVKNNVLLPHKTAVPSEECDLTLFSVRQDR